MHGQSVGGISVALDDGGAALTVAERDRPGLGLARRLVRLRADLIFAALDAVLVACCFTGLLVVRFDGAVPASYWSAFRTFLPVALGCCLAANWVWGLYSQLWRHASVQEARRVLLSGGTSLVALLVVNFAADRLMPLSVIVFGAIGATVVTGANRFRSRLFAFHRRSDDQHGMRVAVLGAGETGAALVRDMLRAGRGVVPVALLDDAPAKQGRGCMGVKVLGGIADLPRIAAERDVHQVVLAIPSAGADVVRRAAAAADEAGLSLRVVPGMAELVGGQVSMRDVRDLRIEDLLGRQQVATDLAAVHTLLSGRRVLVTGAGGSIGSEIARQVAACRPADLVLIDSDESNLHDTATGLARPCVPVLCDIRRGDALRDVLMQHRPEVLFHAAALKHVPLLEAHPCEAAETNVLGTAALVRAARLAGVGCLVFISTDKAVRPSSVMGATKQLAEQIVLAERPDGARYCAVRFGNVLGSRGSVIPTFLRQIAAGGPVTVTDARMTRYFMSTEEAVQLVLQAAALAEGGEVFMLEMGEPVRILDLAARMIRLSGRRVGTDIEIRVTGVRPGEKLREELSTPEENATPSAHPAILRLRPRPWPAGILNERIATLTNLIGQRRGSAVAELLLTPVDTGVLAIDDIQIDITDRQLRPVS